MKYRKKPVVIEAYQFTMPMNDVLPQWLQEKMRGGKNVKYFSDPPYLEIVTLEGTMRADVNDWIIKGVKGEIYPCKPDIFEATYEAVTE